MYLTYLAFITNNYEMNSCLFAKDIYECYK